MTFLEMQDRILGRLEETVDNPRFFTRNDVKMALNEGYEEMSEASQWLEANLSINKTANTYYDLSALFAHDRVIAVTAVFNDDTLRWLLPAAIPDLEIMYDRWETVQGEPSRFFTKGLYQFGVFPKWSAGTGTFRVYYSLVPVSMVLDTDVPGFPQEYHDGIMEYALYDLITQDDELREARAHFDRYVGMEKALKQYVNSRIALERMTGMQEAGRDASGAQ